MSNFDNGYACFKAEKYDEAIHYFRCGACRYSVDPHCASYLAYCHEKGYGTHQDLYTALVWYRLSVDAGGKKWEDSWVGARMRALEVQNPRPLQTPEGIVDSRFGYVRFVHDPRKNVGINFIDGYIKVSGNFRLCPYDAVLGKVSMSVEQKEDCRRSYRKELPEVIDERFSCDYDRFKLRIERGRGRKFTHRLEGDCTYVIEAPANVVFEHVAVRETIRNYIRRLVREEARRYLPARMEYYSVKTGLPYRRCEVKPLVGCLGLFYCNSKNILLDPSLILHTQDSMDSVIVHELCHNISTGHGKKFHDALLEYGGERLYKANMCHQNETFPIY